MTIKQKSVMIKEYSGESITDIENDIYYSLDNLEKDENGFIKGKIIVEVWIEQDD